MKIAVFYGGRSCEHDISIITAVQAMAHLNPEKYEIWPVYMRCGGMYTGDCLKDISFYETINVGKCTKLWLIDGVFYTRVKKLLIKKFSADVALICCHGGEGENGILQGLLDYNGIPYTSAQVMASSVSMDKVISKQLYSGLLFNTVDELCVLREDYRRNRDNIVMHVETFLDYPVIVKPSSLGSSIGINRVCNRAELLDAIEVAAGFDKKIIVERALSDFIELNCAVVSDGKKTIVSEIEKPLSWQDFLTFDEKYLAGGKGMSGEKRELPADISAKLRDNVREISERLYADLDLSGVVRIDYLLSGEGKLYVNEVNTIPGSLAYYLFEPLGISYSDLLDILVDGAIYRYQDNQKSRLAYNSTVLRNFNGTKRK